MKLNCKRMTITLLAMIVLLAGLLCFINANKVIAYAENDESSEIFYFDDLAYSSSSEAVQETETITYSYKTVNEYKINNTYPQYYNGNANLTNFCANVAGANIIGFYDRYYNDLIPNHNAGVLNANNVFSYYPMSIDKEKKQELIDTLYVMMSTNNPNAGTTQNQYKTGLTNYVNNKGSSISFSSVMSNGSLDFSLVDLRLKEGKPISLFLSGYNISSTSDNNVVFSINKSVFSTNHIMIVFGYKQIYFYNENDNLITTKTLLYIASGSTELNKLYVLNSSGTINDAESAYIF